MRDDDDLPIIEDQARKRAIELLMRTDRPRYFRDEAVQREYLEILEREEARQQGGERKPLATGADVSIPVERSTVGQLRRDRVGAVTGTQSEVQAGRNPAVDQNLLSLDPVDLLYLDGADSKRIDDSRVLSDVTPDNDWMPGAQYAQGKRTPATGTVTDVDGTPYYKRGGHHEVPQALYRKWNLKPETERVFDEASTGRLPEAWVRKTPDGMPVGNYWSEAHKIYSDAVGELCETFFARNGLLPKDMTPDDARSLTKEIRESRDARIRDFNASMRLLRRLFPLRTGRGLE